MLLEREGSMVEFSAFLDERQLPLLRLAIALCGSRPAAEDVLQEVLLRAFTQWTRIGELESPYGYVRTMLVNEHLSWRRRLIRQLPRAEIDGGGVRIRPSGLPSGTNCSGGWAPCLRVSAPR